MQQIYIVCFKGLIQKYTSPENKESMGKSNKAND